MPVPPRVPDLLELLAPLLALAGAATYLAAALRLGGWPRRRTLAWLAGSLAAVLAVTGPVAEAAHHDFAAHALGHLLLGMLAPLLLSLGAPLTLALRVLPVRHGRRLVKVLRTRLVSVLTEPGVAAVLNVGGLWLLYRSGLYEASTHAPGLHLLVHAHMLLAGYLFTVAVAGTDPMPHRRPYPHRAVVLVLALAAHGILAKTLWASPPSGVPAARGELGAMIMYYGGDAVDIALGVLLCARWYRAARLRTHRLPVGSSPSAG